MPSSKAAIAGAGVRQPVLYLFIGLASAAIDVGLFKGLLHKIDYLLAASVSYAASFIFNYLCHAYITFKAKFSYASLARYAAVVAGNYVLTLAMVAAAKAALGDPMPGKLAALVLVAIVGFLCGRYWIFKTT